MNKKLNTLLMTFIKKNLNKTEEELEILEYGIQVVLITVYKLIILFVTAYVLKIFTYTLIAFVVFGLLRSFAAGVHASSSIKCIFVNYIVFLGNVFLSLNFKLNQTALIVLFLISLILIIKYSPADTAERPLVSKKLRKSLKLKSIIIVLLCFILCLFLTNPIYRNIITFAVLEEAFLITPLAYSIFRKPYNNYLDVQL